jgi:predicted dehydrogenase
MKQLTGSEDIPLNINITVNAGMIPANHWTLDPETGGGRLIGEVCHFIDLCAFLTGSMVTGVFANTMGADPDSAAIVLRFANGSNATINYFTNGSKAYDKERVEVYSSGRTLVLENWRRLTGYGFSNFSSSSGQQDKGHAQQFRLLAEKLTHGGDPLISFDSLVNTSRATLAVADSVRCGEMVYIPTK